MRDRHWLFMFALSLGCLSLDAGGADAAVLRVALDGSGDYTVVQDAVEAAASADTISIAPGEYTEMRPASPVGNPVIAWVYQTTLTFIGDDASTVILGQAVQGADPEHSPTGIGIGQNRELYVRGVTIRNMGNGILCDGDRLVVSDCDFEGNFEGIDSAARFQTDVRECYFEGQKDRGLVVFNVLGATGCSSMTANSRTTPWAWICRCLGARSTGVAFVAVSWGSRCPSAAR
jgi:hypothetical protein